MQAGDPCTTPDGRSGYLLASGDKYVCQVQTTETFETYSIPVQGTDATAATDSSTSTVDTSRHAES